MQLLIKKLLICLRMRSARSLYLKDLQGIGKMRLRFTHNCNIPH